MKQGFYKGMSFDDYARIDAVNASLLNCWPEARMRHEMVSPREDTAALAFGLAFHCAILEPARFDAEFCVAPKVDRRTKEGKLRWEMFQAEAAGRRVMTEQEHGEIHRMALAALGSAIVQDLLTGKGANEAVVVWEDDGGLCKGRIDRIAEHAGYTWVVDVKTVRRADPFSFARAVASYGWHRAAAWYLRGLRAVSPHERRFVHIAIEKEPPHLTAVYELDDAAIRAGDTQMTDRLRAFRRASESGSWPGFPDGINPLSLPEWALRGVDGFDQAEF